MQSLELISLLKSYQEFIQSSSDFIPRNICVPLQGSKIIFISGPGHAGKTSFLKYIASTLEGTKIYIDFKDNKIQPLVCKNLQVLEEAAAEICNQNSEKKDPEEKEIERVYYFLDEIQSIPQWEKWIEELSGEADGIFITSRGPLKENSLLNFESMAKTVKLLPFSFKEYLLIKSGRVPKPDLLTPSRRDEVLCTFLQYFENGGFPEIAKKGNPDLARNYFEEIIQKQELAENIQAAKGLRKLTIFLISNMASEYSLDTLKKVSEIQDEEALETLLRYLEDEFLLYRVSKHDDSSETKGKTGTSCKVYIGDTGFFKAVYPNYPDSLGLRFENLVFLELLRQGKEIFYYKERNECDFLIKEKDNQKISAAIQTSIYFGSPAGKEREFLGLLSAMEKYELDEGLILTMDDEEILEIEIDGLKKKIIIKPVWKWMLE